MNTARTARSEDDSSFLLPTSSLSRACMPMGATDPCKIGAMGSTPIRSTDKRAHGPTGRHQSGRLVIRVRFPVGPLKHRDC